MSIEFYEITDPFAMDFGLNVVSKPFVLGKNLKSYIIEECNFFSNTGDILEGTYIPKEQEIIYVSYDIGWSLVQAIIQIIIAVVISLIMSAIFAPDIVDLSDNRPKYATYLWGKGKTKSKSMLAVPILLGKFTLFGNLVSSSSKTEIHHQSIHTLYDNIHLLYGMCANKISSLDTFYLSGIDASSYHDPLHVDGDGDLAVFYTKGENTQLPIQAFQDLTDSGDAINQSYPDTSPTIFRYGDLDNDPLGKSEVLLPDFTTEYYPGWLLEAPEHSIKDALMTYDAISTLDGKIELVGVCDVNGVLEASPDIPISTTLPFYIRVVNITIENTAKSIDCSDNELKESQEYSEHCIYADGGDIGFSTDVQHWEQLEEYRDKGLEEGTYVLDFDKINVHSPGAVLKKDNTPEKEFRFKDVAWQNTYWRDSLLCEWVSYTVGDATTDGWGVLKVIQRTNSLYPIEVGRKANGATVDKQTIQLKNSRWYAHLTQPGTALSFTTTSTFGVEDIIFNFAALKGFFSRDIRESNPVRYFGAWVSLKWKITQKLNGSTVAVSILSPTLADGTNRPPTYADAASKNPKYITGCYKESFMFTQSISDLLKFEATNPIGPDTGIQQDGSTNLIELSDKGYLVPRNSSGQAYTYTVEVQVFSHGMDVDSRGYYDVWQSPTDEQREVMDYKVGDETPPTITVDLKVHRITEVNYEETLNYPGIALLGLSINATAAINNTLPDIQVVCSNEIRYSNTTGAYSTWTKGFSNNPAYICLDILYDTFYGAALGGSTLSSTKDADFAKLVDIDMFKEFADYCDEPTYITGIEEDDIDIDPSEVINDGGIIKPKRHVCNGVLDDDLSIWETLIKILKSADAKPVLIGRKISLTWEHDYKQYGDEDEPILTPSMIFSSSNILKDSLTETFQSLSDYTHSASGSFYDAANKYTQTACNLNMHTYNTNKDLTKDLAVDLFGITNKYRAHRKLMKAIRSSNLPRHTYKFTTNLTGLNLSIGDVIGLNYELIDWSVDISADVPVTLSGRVLSSTRNSFTLDKAFTFIDGAEYKFLAFNPNTNIFQTYDLDSYNFNTGTTTIIVNVESSDYAPTYFPQDTIYLIGKSDLLKKEVVILETSFDNNNGTTEVTAYEYSYDLFRYEDYLAFITDSGDYHYNEYNCTPRNFEVTAEEYSTYAVGPTVATKLPVLLNWAPPLIALGNKESGVDETDTVNDMDKSTVIKGISVPVEGYEVYRRIGNISSNDSSYAKNWHLLGVTGPSDLSFEDENLDFHVIVEYKVRPVFLKEHRRVTIPSNWCPVDSIYVDLYSDFLSAPEITDYDSFDNADDPDFYDVTLSIQSNKIHTRDASHEFYGLWIANRADTSTSWLGPLDITLASDYNLGDTTIHVSSTTGLPRVSTSSSSDICCILAINYEDIVFVYGEESTNVLKIASDYSSTKSALGCFKPHLTGESVRSRHHGFFPIRVFATAAHNGLVAGITLESSTAESIFVYDSSNNTCSMRLPTESAIVDGIEMWDYQIRNDNDSVMWRAQNCTDRVVAVLTGVNIITIESSKFFSFSHTKFPNIYSDLTFGTGGLTQDYAPVKIQAVFRDTTNTGGLPASVLSDGSMVATIEKVGKNDEYTVIGTQHLILSKNYEYGYTSYIKEL